MLQSVTVVSLPLRPGTGARCARARRSLRVASAVALSCGALAVVEAAAVASTRPSRVTSPRLHDHTERTVTPMTLRHRIRRRSPSSARSPPVASPSSPSRRPPLAAEAPVDPRRSPSRRRRRRRRSADLDAFVATGSHRRTATPTTRAPRRCATASPTGCGVDAVDAASRRGRRADSAHQQALIGGAEPARRAVPAQRGQARRRLRLLRPHRLRVGAGRRRASPARARARSGRRGAHARHRRGRRPRLLPGPRDDVPRRRRRDRPRPVHRAHRRGRRSSRQARRKSVRFGDPIG